jgi:hypothetical protein
MTVFWIGMLLAAIWLHRLFDAALGLPGLPELTDPEWDREPPLAGAPRVSIVLAARNEEAEIAGTLEALLRLDYPNFEIIAVDDRSTDRTGVIMDSFAARPNKGGPPLRVLHLHQLPEGWMGKQHALWKGAQQARGDWLLFTDADVHFRRDVLRRVLAYAEHSRADHVVLFPTVRMHSVGERMMIAYFQLLFAFGHRPWKVADPRASDYMGIGAFNLVRRRVYQEIGTYEALRMEVIDDMKLGKLVKDHGFAQRNLFGRGLISLRWARGAMGVVDNLTKNMFALMRFQRPRMLGAVALMLFLQFGPFLGLALASGTGRFGYALAVAAIAIFYAGMAPRAGIPAYYVVLHPVSTCLFAYTMLRSMVLAVKRGGVQWRGNIYPLSELRKGLVV